MLRGYVPGDRACLDGMFVGEKSSINQIFWDFGKNGCVFRVP